MVLFVFTEVLCLDLCISVSDNKMNPLSYQFKAVNAASNKNDDEATKGGDKKLKNFLTICEILRE